MYSTESVKVANYVFTTFVEIVEKLRETFPKPFTFTFNKIDDVNFTIYINGNKLEGSDYEKETWKSVPVVDCSIQYYSEKHPETPRKEWLWLRVNYVRGWGSDYGQLKYVENQFIYNKLLEAINTAVKDFTIQETI